MQTAPAAAEIGFANWKVVRQFVQERFSRALSRSSCINYLHRLGFAVKRPKKRLLKAKAEKRAAFVAACLRNHRLYSVIMPAAHMRPHERMPPAGAVLGFLPKGARLPVWSAKHLVAAAPWLDAL